jgi:FkbM family methyltransferase
MRKAFIDCGVREGDAIAAFLGDQTVGGGAYARCLRPRLDAAEFEFVGFESPDYRHLDATLKRFSEFKFSLIEKLVWIHDGAVEFDSDGESDDCRLLQVSCLDGGVPWRHPNELAVVQELPCIDLAKWLLENFGAEDYVVLKLDIEGAEYEVLDRLIETGAISRIRELYVEFHWWGRTSLRERIESYLLNEARIYYRNDWP